MSAVEIAIPIDREHPVIRQIGGRLGYNTVYDLLAANPNSRSTAEKVLSILNQKLMKPDKNSSPLPDLINYHMSSISAPEKEGSHDVGIFILPGIYNSAAGTIIGQHALMDVATRYDKLNLSFTAGLSSSAGPDTLGSPFTADISTRALAQALLIVDQLEKNPVKDYYYVAGSNAGAEVAVVQEAVRILWIKRGLPNIPRIGGVVLFSAAGQFDHRISDAPYFAKRFLRAISLKDEVDQRFPTPEMFKSVATVINDIQPTGEDGHLITKNLSREEMLQREQFKRKLDWMTRTYQEAIALLNEDERNKLDDLDQKLSAVDDLLKNISSRQNVSNDRNIILEKLRKDYTQKRYSLLIPIIKKVLQTTDSRSTSNTESAQILLKFIRMGFPSAFLARPLRERMLMDYPVAFYYSDGERDSFFAKELAYQRMDEWETKEWLRLINNKKRRRIPNLYLPKAPLVIKAESNISHTSDRTDPKRWAADMHQLILNMHRFNYQDGSKKPGQQITLHRTY